MGRHVLETRQWLVVACFALVLGVFFGFIAAFNFGASDYIEVEKVLIPECIEGTFTVYDTRDPDSIMTLEVIGALICAEGEITVELDTQPPSTPHLTPRSGSEL